MSVMSKLIVIDLPHLELQICPLTRWRGDMENAAAPKAGPDALHVSRDSVPSDLLSPMQAPPGEAAELETEGGILQRLTKFKRALGWPVVVTRKQRRQ